MVGAQASSCCILASRFLLHTSFLSPLFILWLWTKPIARNFLHQEPSGGTSFILCVWGGIRRGLLGDPSVYSSLRLREEPWESCEAWRKILGRRRPH